MPHPLCEICQARPAVVFITQTVANATKKGRFCEVCARQKASGEGWLAQLAQGWGDESEAFSNAMRAALDEVPLDEILLELFETQSADTTEFKSGLFAQNAFGDAFDQDENGVESGADSLDFGAFETEIESAAGHSDSERCPHCFTTWEVIKRDGRVGCAACYETFRTLLSLVMSGMQRGEIHTGKTPRAAQKRGRRVQNLQTRRENQLRLLKSRLADAIAAEKYEEAAKLRDKIKATDRTGE